MQALTFGGIEKIICQVVPDPELVEPTDVIVKISLAGICGSDLHVYHGRESGIDEGTVMGHEFTGEIIEAGTGVRKFKKGARVLSPFTTSCGECFYCKIGLTCRCERGNLFGWVQQGVGLQGGQAQYIRVPMADSTLVSLSHDLSDEKGLLLGDVFSTGYFCAENAEIHDTGVYVVIGCGPVGLMTVIAASHLHAEKVFAIDSVPERLEKARQFGAVPVNYLEKGFKEKILGETNGRGADAIMEVVGSPESQRLAIDLVRPGGIISSVGVHTASHFSFSPVEAYNKNLVYKIGRCPAYYYANKLLREEVVQQYPVEEIITHHLPVSKGAEAYKIFDQKLDHCIKPVLTL